ncbi:hypothetical protein [Niveibacterium sp. SC-1]|uniref:hypothetical protein n=1 Tax=Niveibacterium sp. SC-1 TaxID=3135646 RepID=UPI00311E4E2D
MSARSVCSFFPLRPLRVLSLALMLGLVGACGGGGGGDGDGANGSAGGAGSSGGNTGGSNGGTSTPPPVATGEGPSLGACPVFPASAIFNTRIDSLPVHAQSAGWLSLITGGGSNNRALHADWGTEDNPAQTASYYGIPYNLLGAGAASTTWPTLSFNATDPRAGGGTGAPDESDCGVPNGAGGFSLQRGCQAVAASQLRFPYPVDSQLKAEGGQCNDAQTCGDRHVLVVEQGSCRLWESYFSYHVDGQWYAYSTAAWDLNSNAMRPDGRTSADAAGLPILPLLARVDEADANDIRHAFRVTFRDSVLARSAVWPARHAAGGSSGSIPFGAVLRLKSSFSPPAAWGTQARAIAAAMQRYGLYVADIGSDLYVQGEPSARWSDQTISQIQGLHMNDFEFVDLGAITGRAGFDGNSYRATW